MTYKKIVVGLDQSFKDSAVFARALEQTRRHSTAMTIIHTLKRDPSYSPLNISSSSHTKDARDMMNIISRQHKERLERDKRKAHSWLEMYCQQALAKGIPTQVNCQSGNPGLWICETAQRWDADLIVIGHRENHGLRSVGNSSVTQYVLQHAPCTVMVVQGVAHLDEMNHFDRDEPTKPINSPAERRLASQMFKI
ncbi:universal stress protein [filamentous cyanobacterium LEGE 11480]|uniref:Universal stress protein n=1 Tax=Romeriopsis navalis LEGE 11480 TaxID=2777977 RepID=A0A928VM28_9CYAN|nr:universal stress protein [Romeriopsis navalis]MBE9028499.1 universal stress protein [Romeriopsis navalis LEGE 11480]